MNEPLNILHVEDNPTDASLVETLLRTEGIPCRITCVKTQEDFASALNHKPVDLILSDFSMPRFDGLSALKIARVQRADVPFIFVSGTIGEELAVEALKQGATDYVLKDHLSRLPACVQRAMRETQDLIERRRVEEQLRQSEERFQIAARATQDVVWDWNLQTGTLWRNANFEHHFGYPPGEELSLAESWHGRIHPADADRVLKGIRAIIDSGGQIWSDEYRFMRADGSVAHVFDRAYILRDSQKQPKRVIGAMMDITSRRESEERIREQAALLDEARDAICLHDLTQKILYWNKSAERLYGWTAAQAVGKNADDLLFEDELAGPKEALRSLIRHGEWNGELHQITRDNRKIIVESRWTLLRDEHGDPRSILVINTDITERKLLEAKFLRTQRLESIGALAGGIAHDLNNALAPILMAASLLRQESISEEGLKTLEIMVGSARRGADMVRQILSFSRGVGGQHTTLEIRQVVTELVKLVKETFPRSVTVQTRLPAELHPVMGNSTQLHQVLLNLCVNSRDAMPDGGSLTIEAENITFNGSNLLQNRSATTTQYVLLKVSDTGHGIVPELMDKIFEPFFTTKEFGQGTGLGLSTVIGIVKTHGGFVDVASRVGLGTTFKIYLPAIVASNATQTDNAKIAIPSGEGELLLLVDDEAAILELTKLNLESFNYRVITASNGAEALALYQQHGNAISAVITDMMMPIMNGPQMVKSLRALNPSLKIIGMSGLGSETVFKESKDLRTDAFLKKPFTAELLLRELRRVIQMPETKAA